MEDLETIKKRNGTTEEEAAEAAKPIYITKEDLATLRKEGYNIPSDKELDTIK
jgi:hypothetical protein